MGGYTEERVDAMGGYTEERVSGYASKIVVGGAGVGRKNSQVKSSQDRSSERQYLLARREVHAHVFVMYLFKSDNNQYKYMSGKEVDP